MEREITVPVLEGTYRFTVTSPEEEEVIRKAAKAVNDRAALIRQRHPGKTEAEIGRMIALNEAMVRVKLQMDGESLGKEIRGLHAELESYLEKFA